MPELKEQRASRDILPVLPSQALASCVPCASSIMTYSASTGFCLLLRFKRKLLERGY